MSKQSMVAQTVAAPGKVNLHIGVGPLRHEGYHSVVNLLHAVSLYDEVTVAPASRLIVEVEGSAALSSQVVSADRSNLAARAAMAVAARLGQQPSVRIRIRKRLPAAAGMAGGSADAAAALVACHRLWDGGLSDRELEEMGAALGCDVPFMLRGGTVMATGRGDTLTDLSAVGPFHWVFAFSTTTLSTPEVYNRLDRQRAGSEVPLPRLPSPELLEALESCDAKSLGKSLSNELQPAAVELFPPLAEVMALGASRDTLAAVVSGTGPTCAFLVESAAHAQEVIEAVRAHNACSDAIYATGPVPGPVTA